MFVLKEKGQVELAICKGGKKNSNFCCTVQRECATKYPGKTLLKFLEPPVPLVLVL